jgi:hypothetical protein
MYWQPVLLKPNATREVGYAYGLAQLAAAASGKLAVSLAGLSFAPEDEFTVLAYVKDPGAKQSVTLEPDAGLTLVDGAKKQDLPLLPSGEVGIVTWKVKGTTFGRFNLTVTSSTQERVSHPVTIFRPRLEKD